MSHWENVYAAGQQLNRYPYPEIVSFVKRYGLGNQMEGCTALDIGCGSGVHAYLLAIEGAKVVAFDGSPSAIKHASALHEHERIRYVAASLNSFDAASQRFDLTVDRLSSTCAPRDAVRTFYQGLRPHLSSGARLFWQGFDTENSGRNLGRFDPETQIWTGFSSGVFAAPDTISFFSEDDLNTVFEGYSFVAKRMIVDTDLRSGYRHSYWSLELSPS